MDKQVRAFVDRLYQEDVCLHGFELRSHGRVIAEGYAPPFAKGQMHRMYSVSKSMVSLAVGMLTGDGLLSLDTPIVDYFPDKLPPHPDERLLRLKVRDMLRMATCHRKTTYVEGESIDWAATFFMVKPTHEPGTLFAYDTSCSQVLGALCERLSGMPLLDFLTLRLFSPLEANDAKQWLTDPSGVPQGGTGLCMSLRDLGKVAQCVMDGGQGLIPPQYLEQALTKQIDTPFPLHREEGYGYGWQFWQTRSGWAMYGMGGQLAIGCPKADMLLCTIADTRLLPQGVQPIFDAFFDELVGHELSPDDACIPLRLPPVSHDDALTEAFGACYHMDNNPLGLQTVHFAGETLVLQREAECLSLPLCFGQVTQTVLHQTPCLVSSGFTSPHTLRLRCHFIGDAPCGFELLLAKSGSAITVQARRSGDPLTVGWDGFASGIEATA